MWRGEAFVPLADVVRRAAPTVMAGMFIMFWLGDGHM